MNTPAIRDDLAEAYRLAWEHVANPGSWWTGAQRVELARTVLLSIDEDDPLPPWVGVTTSDRLAGDRLAPDAAHDVAYRIGRHAGTMTDEVYRAAVEHIGELQYVELCGIVSSVAAYAHFCRNVGIDRPPLPEPVDGDPTGERPEVLVTPRYNWVPVEAPADQLPAVVQAYTAVPGEMRNTWRMASAQYMPGAEMVHADWTRRAGGLTRPQMELVAARVAQLRECFY
jgi:hypothetical protein